MWPLRSRTFITPGSRWQGRSVLWHYKKNPGRKCQRGWPPPKKQHRPNDLQLPWPVSKHSVVRFSHHQVLFPQHNKVRTWGSQWQLQKNPPTVQREENDLAKHTKNKGNFQFTPMKPFLGGGKTSRFVPVLFSGPPCPWNKKTFMRNMDTTTTVARLISHRSAASKVPMLSNAVCELLPHFESLMMVPW